MNLRYEQEGDRKSHGQPSKLLLQAYLNKHCYLANHLPRNPIVDIEYSTIDTNSMATRDFNIADLNCI